MPIYEYECEKCQHRFEVMQKFSDRPLKKCDKCGGRVHKLLSAPGLVFKGSGWYVTDYANPERKKAQIAERDAGGNGDKKTEKTDTADSKPSTTASKKED